MPFDLLIFGCGYLGTCVAERFVARGSSVAAVTRSPAKATDLAARGIEPILADLMQPETLARLPKAKTILYSVGYDRASPCSKRDLYVEGLRNVLHAIQGQPSHLVYVSSTSVYGQDDGGWIDETSPTAPMTEGGTICREAEQLLIDAPRPTATILRLAGLYGPDRLIARVEQLRAGEPVGGNPEAWLNLIHRDDAATACEAALASPRARELFLVSDDRPITRREYYSTLARLVGAPEPIFSEAVETRRGTTGWNKRCANRRVKERYGISWQYATIETGLGSLTHGTVTTRLGPGRRS